MTLLQRQCIAERLHDPSAAQHPFDEFNVGRFDLHQTISASDDSRSPVYIDVGIGTQRCRVVQLNQAHTSVDLKFFCRQQVYHFVPVDHDVLRHFTQRNVHDAGVLDVDRDKVGNQANDLAEVTLLGGFDLIEQLHGARVDARQGFLQLFDDLVTFRHASLFAGQFRQAIFASFEILFGGLKRLARLFEIAVFGFRFALNRLHACFGIVGCLFVFGHQRCQTLNFPFGLFGDRAEAGYLRFTAADKTTNFANHCHQRTVLRSS